MAAYDYDPIDGSPLFRDSDPPDIKVDPRAAAIYAAEVGNRIVGTTLYLNAYAYKREGLAGFDTTLGCSVVCRGGTWKRDVSFRVFSIVRGGMTDGTVFFQVPTEDATKDTEPAFTYAYNPGDGKLTLEAGVYLIHATSHPGAVVTGTTFMQLRAGTQGILDRKNPVLNADPVMSLSAQFRADGTEGLYIEMQKATGGSSNSSGTLRITRVSGL